MFEGTRPRVFPCGCSQPVIHGFFVFLANRAETVISYPRWDLVAPRLAPGATAPGGTRTRIPVLPWDGAGLPPGGRFGAVRTQQAINPTSNALYFWKERTFFSMFHIVKHINGNIFQFGVYFGHPSFSREVAQEGGSKDGCKFP